MSTAHDPRFIGWIFADLKTEASLGARLLHASLRPESALTAKTAVRQSDQLHADELWIYDSGASERMAADATGLEG